MKLSFFSLPAEPTNTRNIFCDIAHLIKSILDLAAGFFIHPVLNIARNVIDELINQMGCNENNLQPNP